MAGEWDAFPAVASAAASGSEWDAFPKASARPTIDFDQPLEKVRAAIAALPEAEREGALTSWADAFVKKERAAGGIGQTVDDTVRTLARGTFVGPWLDEITAKTSGMANRLTGGAIGSPEDETLAYQRAKDRAVDTEAPVLSTVGKLAGGLAGAGVAMRAGGNLLDKGVKVAAGGPLAAWQPAATLKGRVAQGVATGVPYGAASAAGNAEGGSDNRLKAAEDGAVVGGMLGAIAPVAIQGAVSGAGKLSEALSPQIARAGGNLKALRERLAIRASADGSGPAVSEGADAAAEQIIANQLARANVTVPQLRQRFAEADEAARFSSSGRGAQNVLAPVDIDPSLQRLAGSVARQQPEAGNMGMAFQAARQTGQPAGMEMPRFAALPVRPAMARVDPDAGPMGQFERVKGALRQALNLKDYRSHGMARSAYATENMIINRAKTDANKLYGDAYKASQGVDIRPHIEPVMAKWAAEAAEQPEAVGRAIRQMMRQFNTQTGPVSDLRRFQKAKEFADGLVQKWFKSPEGRNKYVGGVLAQLQREMIEAIDNIPNVGPLYKQARDTFSDEMTLRDALKLGREVLRDDSEVVVDQFRALATKGEQKMFRLGMLDGFEQKMGRQKRTADVTQIFQTPRVQEILQEVIPNSKKADAVFANRPERFGQYLANEKRMIETRNQTMGNSKTAERLADDEALDNMQGMQAAARDAMRNPSASNLVMRAVEGALNKLFGFRADTAAAIAQKLYTASPLERELLLSALERRLGPSRSAHLARLMQEYQQTFSAAGTAAGGGAAGQQGNQ